MECDSVERFQDVIRQHEIKSCYRYASYKAQKDFGHTSLSTAKKVYWKDWSSVQNGRQEFNGTPFVVLNKKVYDCQYGKNRKEKRKQRRKAAKANTEMDYESYVKKPNSKFIVQDTRKIDCPAQVTVREICRFPAYQISLDASHFQMESTAQDLLVRIHNGEEIQHKRVFILILPDSSVHTCHKRGKTHPSVRIKGTETNYSPVQCFDPVCADKTPHMHCPFCVKTELYTDPVILKAHYRVKHVDKGIEFAGLKVLRCCDRCDIVGVIKGEKKFKGAHWHCYKCRNGFNRRDEAIKHYKTHFRNPQTTFQIQIAQDINQPVTQAFETEEAAACIPTDSFSVSAGLTEGISNHSGNLTLLGRSLDGMVSMPGVGAVETVGVADTQTIMIIQDDGQGNLGVQELCSSQDADPPDLTTSDDIDDSCHDDVQELREKVAQLEKEKAEQKAHIVLLSKKIEEQAEQIAAYKVREQGLLEQMHQLQQSVSLPQDRAIQDLCSQLESQHKQLIRQQITQLKHSLVHTADPQPKMLVLNANTLGAQLGQTVNIHAFDTHSNNASQVAVALEFNTSNANEVDSSSIQTEISEVDTTDTVDDGKGTDEIENDNVKDDNFVKHTEYSEILVQNLPDELDGENPIIENDGSMCDEPAAKRRKGK